MVRVRARYSDRMRSNLSEPAIQVDPANARLAAPSRNFRDTYIFEASKTGLMTRI